MTRDDMIRLAHEAGWKYADGDDGYAPLWEFGKLVAAAEREACIKLIEDFSKTTMVPVRDTWVMGLIAGANALRARGQE